MPEDGSFQEMLKCKNEAVNDHQKLNNFFRTSAWMEFKPSGYGKLKRELEIALSDDSEEKPSANLKDGTGYRHIEQKHLNKIFDFLEKGMENHRIPKNILSYFLFVYGKGEDGINRYPLIRIPQFDIPFEQNNVFIDSFDRFYKNFPHFLETNKLHENVICYPKNGVYSTENGSLRVEGAISPAQRTGTVYLKRFDYGVTALNMAGTGLSIAADFFPHQPLAVAGAGLSAITAVYAAKRNTQTLVDRKQHEQTIDLASAEPRNCWLGIGGGVMSIVSFVNMVLNAEKANESAARPSAGQMVIRILASMSCIIYTLTVGSELANIIVKAVNEEEITGLDGSQFTSAGLSLTQSVISLCFSMFLFKCMMKNSSRTSARDINV